MKFQDNPLFVKKSRMGLTSGARRNVKIHFVTVNIFMTMYPNSWDILIGTEEVNDRMKTYITI